MAYLLLRPAWSLVSFGLRGYKGDLSPAQALDMVTSQDYVLIDVRSEKDKGKDGVPQLPSNAKNKLISLPYLFPLIPYVSATPPLFPPLTSLYTVFSQAGGASKQDKGHGAKR